MLIEFPVSGWERRCVLINTKDIVWVMHGKDADKKNRIDTTGIKLTSGDVFCIDLTFDTVKHMLESCAVNGNCDEHEGEDDDK
jgi:hypothetical protein